LELVLLKAMPSPAVLGCGQEYYLCLVHVAAPLQSQPPKHSYCFHCAAPCSMPSAHSLNVGSQLSLLCAASALSRLSQRKLQGVDLWRTSFNVLKGSLISAGQLLTAWASEARTFSSDWAVGVDAGGHMWEGVACADSYLAAFQDRLEQVWHVYDV
jgi:hypothetical protein